MSFEQVSIDLVLNLRGDVRLMIKGADVIVELWFVSMTRVCRKY